MQGTGQKATEFDQIELVNEPSSYTLSLQLEVHFMSCWLIFKLPKGPIYDFFLRIIPSHVLGCGTREFCLYQRASSSRALFSVVVTWSTRGVSTKRRPSRTKT